LEGLASRGDSHGRARKRGKKPLQPMIRGRNQEGEANAVETETPPKKRAIRKRTALPISK